MAQSRTYKKRMNFVYGMGAAVVIIGALFKIQHFSLPVFGLFEISGGLMLTIGLIVEAGVFAVSAFDTPEDDFDWTKVYPELGQDEPIADEKLGADGMLSQKLDNLLQEAKIDSALMASLGSSMKNFQNAAEGLSAASESLASTNRYNEQVSLAAVQMESLNNLYKSQVENSSKQAELNAEVVEATFSAASESVASTNKYNEQVSLAAVQMETLNNLYKSQVENSSKQAELNAEVVENTQKLKEQMESLAKNLSSLNGVYGGMLSAMNVK